MTSSTSKSSIKDTVAKPPTIVEEEPKEDTKELNGGGASASDAPAEEGNILVVNREPIMHVYFFVSFVMIPDFGFINIPITVSSILF